MEHAKKMQYLAKVWDGSKGKVGDNYGISRPRSVQICARTKTLLQAYYAQP